jgi:muramoyltetrapeptide carboxypeptidase
VIRLTVGNASGLADNQAVKKHIYIYSPSGAVRDKAAFKRGVKRLQTLGHEVEVDVDALTSHQRFAGDDAIRVAAIHRAAASGADVALISRGGYGLTRILSDIPYKAINKAVERGTSFVGMSDFKKGTVTWAGPALCEGFGVGGKPAVGLAAGATQPLLPDDIMEDCFNDLVLGQGEGSGWCQDKDVAGTDDLRVEGATLWGGNLTLVTSLLGTPYFPQVKRGILFLEDVAEHPYRVERMLTQLLHAGVLARQKAIVLGQFTDFKLTPHDKGFNLKTVVAWLRTQVKTPILTNLPYGHVQTKVLLPVGAKLDLVVDGREALLYWGHPH